jgi:hypothetical protein
MNPLLLVLAALSPVYYEATVPTFGCNSTQEVEALLAIRHDPVEFQKQLITKAVYGQCVTVAPGAVVDGSVDETDRSILRIEASISPPGLMAPAGDFKLRDAANAPDPGTDGAPSSADEADDIP